MGRSAALGILVVAAWVAPAAGQRPAPAGEWQLPGHDYASTRHSSLVQLTPQNVAGLKAAWSFSTGLLGAHEGSPLVVGSVMYLHSPFPNAVFALDLGKPGAPVLWSYAVPAAVARAIPPTGCCDAGSRGLAYHPSGKLFVPLLHGELAALDAKTGKEIWRLKNADGRLGATMAAAPLVVKDLVIVGTGGAEFGVRGTLTNFRTIRNRLARLEQLEKLLPSDEFGAYSKKMQSSLRREYRKMLRNLGGIRTLARLPECLVVIDPKKEKNAINEARKTGITTVALIDTDCDPDVVDLPIPGNDDSIRSIELVAARLADAILEGKAQTATEAQVSAEGADVSTDEAGGSRPAKPAPRARPSIAKRAVPKPPKT